MIGRGLVAVGAALATWATLARLLPEGAPAGIMVLGLVYGGIYALQAIGIVLVFRASRIVNFSQAELGSFAGVVAVSLVAQRGVPFLIGVPIGLAIAGATGVALHVLVMHRLRAAPRLIASVATIAAAQVVSGFAALLALRLADGPSTGTFQTPLSGRFTIAPVTFSGDHVFVVIVVGVVLVALTAFLKRTDYGIAIRAAADNADRATVLGVPVGRLTSTVWGLAGVLSALAVLLRLPIDGFTSFSAVSSGGPAILVRTLAAAVIARLERPGLAVAAALGIGVTDSLTSWTTGDSSYVDAVLVGVILLALLLQRSGFSRREENELASSRFQALREIRPIPRELAVLPEVRWGSTIARLSVLAFALSLPLWTSPSQQQLAAVVVIYAMVGTSIVLLTGWAGQISLGHWALVGLGGTAAATLYGRHGWDFFAALPAGAAVAAAAALVIGLPALRVRGPFLAVSTLAFALSASSFLFSARSFPWLVTDRIERPVLWGRLRLDEEWQVYLLALVALVAVMGGLAALRRSRVGRVIIASRDNKANAEAVGISTTAARLLAFVLSGAIAGVAGVLYVTYQEGFRADAFGPQVSLQVFSLAVIGGLGSLSGAVLGAVYLRGAEFFLPAGWDRVASGFGVLVLLLVAPGGLGELADRARLRLLRHLAARRGIDVPSLTADRADTSTTSDTDGGTVAPAIAALADTGDAQPALEVRALDAGYDRVQILFDVDFSVRHGEIVALLGTNGAGKSTLLKVCAGLLDPTNGVVSIGGRDATAESPQLRAGHGLGVVPGGRGVFANLTVAENLRMAGWLRRREPDDGRLERIRTWFPRLVERWDAAAGDLSGGEQQQLSLAMAFLPGPDLLLIDELSLGLSPIVAEDLFRIVRDINREGVTVVLVEQSVSNALRVADRAVFLEKGQPRYDGPTHVLLERPDVLRAVFLTDASAVPVPVGDRIRDEVRLRASGLSLSYGGVQAVRDVDLEVRRGEIVGIIGPNGAGKTSLFDLLSGFQEPTDGGIEVDGDDVTVWSAARRARSGLGRTFQDARLWPSLTVREAIAVALDRHVEERGVSGPLLGLPISRRSEACVAAAVDDLVESLNLGAHADKFVSELSTGTRRIVELAVLSAHRPGVVLLDEPSGGLAQRETEALVSVLRRTRDELDCSIVLIEHDLHLVTQVSDRLIAMVDGAVVVEGPPADVLRHPVVEAAYLGDAAPPDDPAAGRRRRGQLLGRPGPGPVLTDSR